MLTRGVQWPSLLQGKTSYLLDLDGTLIDSSPCHERAYLQALQEEYPDLAKEFDYELYKGRSSRDTFLDAGVESLEAVDRLVQRKQFLYREMVNDGQVAPFPYVRELLERWHHRKHRLFVVTGASRRSAEAALGKLQLLPLFESLITGDDVPQSKPAPDPYLECLKRHAIAADSALAVEDASAGVEAAKCAGLDVLAVNNPNLSHLPEYVGTLRDLYESLLAIDL